MKSICFAILLFLPFNALQAQEITENLPEISLGGYIDLFYGYDFNKPDGTSRLPYIYHYNRHNEFNLNHGIISMSVNHVKYRANLGFHTGTYVVDNYTNEPELLKQVFDANIGFSLNKKDNLWLDVGIFGNSHIGTESTQSYSNWTASRTLLSENVPYYQAGANLTYTPDDWFFSFWLLNGWQKIKRIPGNSLPSIGTQITFNGFEKIILNWSTFTGTEYPDATRRMRYFSHLSAVYQITDQWGLTVAWDVGAEQEVKGSSTYNGWSGFLTVVRYTMNEQWATAFRYEYYGDPNEVIVSTNPANGYKTSGLSWNLDYKAFDLILCRAEARYFFSSLDIYPAGNSYRKDNFFLLTTIAMPLNFNP